MGYVAVSLLMKSEDEMMTLVVNSVRNDLISHNNYFQVCVPRLHHVDVCMYHT